MSVHRARARVIGLDVNVCGLFVCVCVCVCVRLQCCSISTTWRRSALPCPHSATTRCFSTITATRCQTSSPAACSCRCPLTTRYSSTSPRHVAPLRVVIELGWNGQVGPLPAHFTPVQQLHQHWPMHAPLRTSENGFGVDFSAAEIAQQYNPLQRRLQRFLVFLPSWKFIFSHRLQSSSPLKDRHPVKRKGSEAAVVSVCKYNPASLTRYCWHIWSLATHCTV